MLATTKNDRNFMKFWIRRARKELAISGRLTELVALLNSQETLIHQDWRSKLLQLRLGTWEPDMEELILLDGALARPRKPQRAEELTPLLF